MTKQYRYGQMLPVAKGTRKATDSLSFIFHLNTSINKSHACEGLEKRKNRYSTCSCLNMEKYS